VLWFLLAVGGAPVAAQGAFSVGLAATLGEGWQMQGADFGLVGPFGLGPLRHWSVTARVGSFIDQGAFFGGQQGIVGALALGVRTGSIRLAELGTEPNFTSISLDVTFETAGYLAANSPLPHGSRWMAAAVLPALRTGGPGSTQFALLIGPAAFLGHETEVRMFLGLRGEWPLAPRKSVP
jgi:hypothetical protein